MEKATLSNKDTKLYGTSTKYGNLLYPPKYIPCTDLQLALVAFPLGHVSVKTVGESLMFKPKAVSTLNIKGGSRVISILYAGL